MTNTSTAGTVADLCGDPAIVDDVRERLGRCPFCGTHDTATFLDTVHTDCTRYAVRCRTCGAQGPTRPTPDGAEAAWEERTE